MDFLPTDLGAVIRTQRLTMTPKMSQKSLGELAGYGRGAGAGVAISRIENGEMSPKEDKLVAIATVFGLTAPILRGEATAHHRLTQDGPADSQKVDAKSKPLKQRARSLHEVVEKRAAEVTESANRFNDAHDRARDQFFVPFYNVAAAIKGAPKPPVLGEDSSEEQSAFGAAAEVKIKTSSRLVGSALAGAAGAAAGAPLGGAVAYSAFTAAATFGTASTGTAIGTLSGAAATNATLAFIGGGSLAAGGAGIAGGTVMLASMVAGPVALLAIGGVFLMTRRSKQKEAELRTQLNQAEQDLHATEAGFQALVLALKDTAELLDYIAVHGAHAQSRWANALDKRSKEDWSQLSNSEQAAYKSFLEVAGAQVSIARVNFGAYLTLPQPELTDFQKETDAVLASATKVVKALI